MRTLFALSALLLLVAACTAPDEGATRATVGTDPLSASVDDSAERVPIDPAKSRFEFEGFGPGKSHVGTFTTWDGELYVRDGEVVGGEGRIDPASVSTGIERLDNHLKTADFFDVQTHREITFASKGLRDGQLTGDLTFLGVTQTLTFPVNVTDQSIAADFVFNASSFGMDYAGVNDEVRIAFTFSK